MAVSRWASFAVLTLLVACATPVARGPIVLVDDGGDSVRLATPATRIASLQPTTTELLFAIGAGDRVVGRTAWCDAPAAALAVPSLGDGLNPNLEAIAAARPDLVLLYPSALNDIAAARLEALGIPVLRVRTDRLADVPRLARLLGRATGREAGADSLVAAFEAELAAAGAPDTTGPRLFILAWDQPLTTIGSASFLSELVTRAGGRNSFGDLASASAPVSLEAVVARDPDAVLVPGERERPFTVLEEWKAVPAFRDGRIVQVAGTEFLRPSPRAPQAVRALAARLRALR